MQIEQGWHRVAGGLFQRSRCAEDHSQAFSREDQAIGLGTAGKNAGGIMFAALMMSPAAAS